MDKSYGILVYRFVKSSQNNQEQLEFLLAHPSGKNGPDFYIPKGKKELEELPLDAAEREVKEETGITSNVEDFLGEVTYKNKRKKVFIWMGSYESGTVLPDGSCPDGDWENDIVKFYDPITAKELLREEFKPLIDKALEKISLIRKRTV